MNTIVLKYETDEKTAELFNNYRRQFTSCSRVFYNILKNEPELKSQFEYQKKGSVLVNTFSKLNNVELINSYMMQCMIVKAYSAVKSNNELKKIDQERRAVLVKQIESLNKKIKKTQKANTHRISRLKNKISRKQSQITAIDNKKYTNVDGSVKLMRDYVSHQWKLRNGVECKAKYIVTKEELQEARLNSIYIIGETLHWGNRFIRLMSDLETVEVCFDRIRKTKSHPMLLKIKDCNKNYKQILKDLYVMQQNNQIALTYTISGSEICISYDEEDYNKARANYKRIANRVMSIDMNPNYLGWSVIEWKSSSEYRVIATGVYSMKDINDEWFSMNGQDIPSDDIRREKNTNKRTHEVFEISNNLMSKALYWKCSIFSLEKLKFNELDMGYGTKQNALCRNLWIRDKFRNNLSKYTSMYGIKFIEVEAKYSSIYGNIIFRKEGFTDPVNASMEIGRRAYELNAQYIEKTKAEKHNIIKPVWDDFKESISEALEAFRTFSARNGRESKHMTDISDLYELYCVLKE